MANTLRFKRGLAAGIPTGVAGEPLFTTDTFDLYIGTGAANQRFQKYIASGTTLQYLRGDGSLATFPTNIVTGTGTTNYLPKFTGASTLGNSLVFDNGTQIGIRTNSPVPYDVNSQVVNIVSSVANAEIKLTNSTTGNTHTAGLLIAQYGLNSYLWNGSAGLLAFGTSNSTRATIDASGNLGLGVTPSAWVGVSNVLQVGAVMVT